MVLVFLAAGKTGVAVEGHMACWDKDQHRGSLGMQVVAFQLGSCCVKLLPQPLDSWQWTHSWRMPELTKSWGLQVNKLHSSWAVKGEGATEIQNADKILIFASNILWRVKFPFIAAWLLLKNTQKGNIPDYVLLPHCSDSCTLVCRPKPN